MKVGIITFHRAINFGAVLQAYALSTVMHDKGLDSEVIDFRGDRVDIHYSPKLRTPFYYLKDIKEKSVSAVFRGTFRWAKQCFLLCGRKRARRKFDKFIKEFIRTSEPTTQDKLYELQKKYDFLLCGSDQVWNLNVVDFNEAYFLSFASPDKRNAYAASIGKDAIPDEQVTLYKKLWKDFKFISVREKNSVDLIEKIAGHEASWVLDPSFLLSQNQWSALSVKPKEIQSPYILVYMLYDLKNESMQDFILTLSNETKLPVVYIGQNRHFKMNSKKLKCVSPNEWLWLFLNTDYVVTNSFHGTAFAINFSKPFCVSLLRPLERPANNRLTSILELFCLTNRIIEKNDSFEDLIHNEINWTEVEKILDVERRKANNYIDEIVDHYQENEENIC